jgi:alginate O-acetyltransferase complex protein AlgI
MITMTLGGLWHGAAWGYLLWGFVHGSLLVLNKQFQDFCAVRPRFDAALRTPLGTVFRVLLTFFCVSMCWVLFQPEFGKALEMFQQLFHIRVGNPLPLSNRSLWYTVGFVAMCHMLVRSGLWRWAYDRFPAPVLGLGYAVCLCLAMLLAPDSGTKFIYFQF